MFAMQILEGQPHVPIMTNHPKQGGIASFMTAIGALALAGRPPSWPALDSGAFKTFKAGPVEARTASALTPSSTTAALESLRTRARPLPEAALPLLHQRLWPFNQAPWIRTMQGTKPSKRTLATVSLGSAATCVLLPRACFLDRWPWTLARTGAERRAPPSLPRHKRMLNLTGLQPSRQGTSLVGSAPHRPRGRPWLPCRLHRPSSRSRADGIGAPARFKAGC